MQKAFFALFLGIGQHGEKKIAYKKPKERIQHSKVGNLSFAAFFIIEARRKGMLQKKARTIDS